MHRNYSTHHRAKGSDSEKRHNLSAELCGIISLSYLLAKTYGDYWGPLSAGRFGFYAANSVDSREKSPSFWLSFSILQGVFAREVATYVHRPDAVGNAPLELQPAELAFP